MEKRSFRPHQVACAKLSAYLDGLPRTWREELRSFGLLYLLSGGPHLGVTFLHWGSSVRRSSWGWAWRCIGRVNYFSVGRGGYAWVGTRVRVQMFSWYCAALS
jgi:hypothetical protein